MPIKPIQLTIYHLSVTYRKFTKNHGELLIKGLKIAFLIICLSSNSLRSGEDIDFLERTGMFTGRSTEDFKMAEKASEISAMDWLAQLDTTCKDIKSYIHRKIQNPQSNTHVALWSAYFCCKRRSRIASSGILPK